MVRIGCIGEVMIEIVSDGGRSVLNVAGDTYNTAAYLAQLGGTQVSYVTALGHDTFSERALADMAQRGIETGAAQRHPTRNIGLYAIDVDPQGERSFTYWRSDSAARTLFSDGDFGVLEQFDVVFLSGISVAILPADVRTALIDALGACAATVVYDSNHRPRLWEDAGTARAVNAAMWAVTDIALPSVDDEMAIFGDADEAAVLARLRGFGVTDGALKRGPSGPYDLASDLSQTYPPAGRVVDTTAAGDSFNAGYLQARFTGTAQSDALRAGHDLAARVIGHRGAIINLKDMT